MLRAIDKRKVTLLPGIFRERMAVNREYLMELDSQCLLQNFYLEAGIVMPGLQVVDDPATANLHWGWEAPTCQLRGHFLGHWLSAAAAYVASDQDMELKAKLDKIVSELARCQELNGGEWMGSFPEKYFQKLADNRYIWSPQYVMHKTIMGLTHAYTDAGNAQALEILDRLSDWYIRWTDAMQSVNPHAVYSGEEGGMLEIWTSLYAITKQEKYLTLAERYGNPGLFGKLLEGKDALTNCHSNASIPLSHGAAKLYDVTGEEKWRTITEQFWRNAVTDRGAYCTCGHNAGEFWVPPFKHGQFLSETNQEFCTVYNMVRTASYLFRWTSRPEYADYIERSLYNGFLAQQHAQTGMPTYFLPLTAGSRKKWGSKTRDFWCCHGTMVQAQALYPELIYYEDPEAGKLIVSQYIPSRLSYRRGEAEICFEQTTDMKYYNDQAFFDERDDSQLSRWALKFTVTASSPAAFSLLFRVPGWVKGKPTVQINGESVDAPEIRDGYLSLTREWTNDTIRIFFPSGLVMEALPDMPELAAIVDGPIVLAGLTDRDCGLTGDFNNPREFLMPQTEHTYATYPWKQNSYRTRHQHPNILFKPLYDITDEVYTVYFTRK
ncbi:beta-L-arabinofuranosidase domain-containing protein [Gorillibacterium sp. sgz500922]|uniref:beta-L-arabinofuranosidase domain-containing protein n=1 Tax=Gorillibacterium sp. sgz500922 TaxID=3446694 RepID=UPI003F66FAF3